MKLIDALANRCLAAAVRRWPAGLREEHSAVWEAEMHAIASAPGREG